ncbi:MAG: protoporphyrinogen oxidase [Pirellula sp.]|nr:protoporphyrinogen oxidase [Pirellula sp.]
MDESAPDPIADSRRQAPGLNRRRIAVIGGGISGLAAAHRLVTLDPSINVTLFEANNRLGGILQTERRDGYLIERSADNFVTNVSGGLELCRELGIEGELLPTDPARRRALVLRAGRLHPVPEGFQLMTPSQVLPILKSPLLSWRGKLRALGECWVPPRREASDESLESFAVRRVGREAYERLVQPLVSGIFTADPAKLSMRAALPKFFEQEQQHGSLIRAARKARGSEGAAQREASGARYSLFVAPRDGMGRIVTALTERLPTGCVRTGVSAMKLSRNGDAWQITVNEGPDESFDGVIVAVSAPHAARLLGTVDAALAADLGQIEYAGATIAVAGYKLDQIANPLHAFGFVVPEAERRDILAASFSSRKFPGRAPDGCVLIRTFLGGAMRPDLVEASDADIRKIVSRELGEIIGLRGEPHLWEVARWNRAMPQYHLGHVDLVDRIESRVATLPGLAVAGNAYRGVGVPQCIRSGRAAAERIVGR